MQQPCCAPVKEQILCTQQPLSAATALMLCINWEGHVAPAMDNKQGNHTVDVMQVPLPERSRLSMIWKKQHGHSCRTMQANTLARVTRPPCQAV
jgi:hypothetical protein